MKDRLGSIAWMGGIIVVLSLMFWGSEDAQVETRPLSDDERAAGMVALSRWMQSSGIPIDELRVRYGALNERDGAAAGNILISHVPMILFPEFDELAELKAWIGEGNTLVVSSSLFESPAWHLTGGSILSVTGWLSGVELSITEEPSLASETEESNSILDVPGWIAFSGSTRTQQLVAVGDHPLGENFDHVEAPWDGTWIELAEGGECVPGVDTETSNNADETVRSPATPHAVDDRPNENYWERAIKHAETGQTAVWTRQLGDGHIILLGHPSLLANAAIHEQGNRQFAMNLITHYLGPQGSVIFDDAHQGSNDLYTPNDLLTDIRVFQTVCFLLICWAVYILSDAGSWERATRERSRSRSGQADLVRASGGYLARRLHYHALANGLLAPLRERLAAKWNLPPERALEDGLKLEGFDNARAHDIKQRLAENTKRRGNAVALHNLILELRRETH